MTADQKPIRLALSGGGTRAMAFHSGVLEFLAERQALERIRNISSVSGGSLLVGLIFHLNRMKWPTCTEYESVLGEVEALLTKVDLQNITLMGMLRPKYWKYALSRANVLAGAIGSAWGIRESVDEVPKSPVWSINATTAESGKRSPFVDGMHSDWQIGIKTRIPGLPLRDAMAASAAFPGLIGPYVLKISDTSLKSLRPSRIHLYDGGVYDNLGLEPFFDAGYGCFKKGMDGTLVASDAGLPLSREFDANRLNPFRLKRVVDILSEQSRSLRARGLVAFASRNIGSAAYLRIGRTAHETAKEHGRALPEDSWLSKDDVQAVATLPTTLHRLTSATFASLRRHGYESASIGNHLFEYV